LNTYIVTSKPKRISVYSGFVHMVKLLERELIDFPVAGRFYDLGPIVIEPLPLPNRKTLKSLS
jgi:hypothetical protein